MARRPKRLTQPRYEQITGPMRSRNVRRAARVSRRMLYLGLIAIALVYAAAIFTD